jgi:hypothetical protein
MEAIAGGSTCPNGRAKRASIGAAGQVVSIDDGRSENGAGAITPSNATVADGTYQPLLREERAAGGRRRCMKPISLREDVELARTSLLAPRDQNHDNGCCRWRRIRPAASEGSQLDQSEPSVVSRRARAVSSLGRTV